jgi:hypothetical protein
MILAYVAFPNPVSLPEKKTEYHDELICEATKGHYHLRCHWRDLHAQHVAVFADHSRAERRPIAAVQPFRPGLFRPVTPAFLIELTPSLSPNFLAP